MMQVQPKVGDEVGYCRRHSSWGTLLHSGFSKVSKINGHGHIHLENGKVFDKHGQERNTIMGLSLVEANRLRDELQHIAQKRARNTTAKNLEELIKGQRNGHGDLCPISDDVRARMVELINQL